MTKQKAFLVVGLNLVLDGVMLVLNYLIGNQAIVPVWSVACSLQIVLLTFLLWTWKN